MEDLLEDLEYYRSRQRVFERRVSETKYKIRRRATYGMEYSTNFLVEYEGIQEVAKYDHTIPGWILSGNVPVLAPMDDRILPIKELESLTNMSEED